MSVPVADRRAAGLVFLVSALLALPFLAGIVMLDEGALVHTADRIASGEVLYRDIATGVGPGAYYLQALLFLFFGRSLLVGRIFMILLFSLTATGVYLLSRAVASRAVAGASALLFAALSVSFWRYPSYSPEAVAWILFSLGAAALYLRGRRRRWLVAAGIGLGMAILFKQNYGALACLGVAAGLMAGSGPYTRRTRDVALAATVAAAPVLLAVVAFAAAGAAGALWHHVVVLPFRLPATLFARPFPPAAGPPGVELRRQLVEYLPFQDLAIQLMPWPHVHLGITMGIVRVLFFLPPAFLLFAILLSARRRRRAGAAGSDDSSVGTLYVATSSLLFLGVFPRVDAHHLVLVLAPSFATAAWVLGRRPRAAARSGLIGAAAVLAGVSAVSQAAAVARVPLDASDLALLPLPRGGVWIPRSLAAQITGLVGEIHRRVPPGEPIFVAPALPMYYFLAERPNPTRFPLILPGALDEEETIRQLEANRVAQALVADFAFEKFTFQFVAPKVWDYVMRTYGPAEGMGWRTHPFPPYFLRRGAIDPPPPAGTLRGGGRGAAEGSTPAGLPPPVAAPEPGEWTVVKDLMRPSLSEAPPYRVVSRDAWEDLEADRVGWESMYLRPALVMRAPWGWRKTLVAWEVPAGPGLGFEFSCAIGPTAEAGVAHAGQGAIVEAWVGPARDGAPPTRAWIRWIDPHRNAGERRWFRAVIDLASFVTTPRARVILVTGPAPTFDAYDAEVAWTGLRLVSRAAARSPRAPATTDLAADPVALDETAVRPVLDFQPQDLSIFQAAARAYAGFPAAHAALGDVAESLGRSDLVLEPRRRAARLEPGNAVYRVRLGEALERAGRPGEAVAEMREAARIEPRHPNYRAALGALFLRLGRWDEARASVGEARRLDRGHPWALTVLSALERQKGDFAAAESAARLALERDRANLRARLDLAEALRGSGRIDEATATLDDASALPLEPRERAVLAQVYAGMDRPDRAVAEWRRVLAARPPGALAEEARRAVEDTRRGAAPAVAGQDRPAGE